MAPAKSLVHYSEHDQFAEFETQLNQHVPWQQPAANDAIELISLIF